MSIENNADEFINKMRPGDVVITSQNGPKMIGSFPIRIGNLFRRGYAKRIWTHTALYVGNGEIIEAQPSGIAKKSFIETYFNKNDFDFVVMRHKSISAEEVSRLVEFCSRQSGSKYDFKALTYFILVLITPPTLSFLLESKMLNKCLNTSDSYFCSELIADGFLYANCYSFDRPPHHVMPVDFNNEYGFNKVEERVKAPQVSKIKKVISICAYVVTLIILTVLILLLAVLIWSSVLWIWNALITNNKSNSNAAMTQRKSPKHRVGTPRYIIEQFKMAGLYENQDIPEWLELAIRPNHTGDQLREYYPDLNSGLPLILGLFPTTAQAEKFKKLIDNELPVSDLINQDLKARIEAVSQVLLLLEDEIRKI